MTSGENISRSISENTILFPHTPATFVEVMPKSIPIFIIIGRKDILFLHQGIKKVLLKFVSWYFYSKFA